MLIVDAQSMPALVEDGLYQVCVFEKTILVQRVFWSLQKQETERLVIDYLVQMVLGTRLPSLLKQHQIYQYQQEQL